MLAMSGIGSPVSVVIPTYNRAHLLPRAMRSVLAQTWSDIEVIVVDDGSTDETPDVVRRFRDARVRLIRLDRNGGAARARNEGIRAASGEWVAFLDDDDEWLLEKLEYQARSLAREESHASVVYCQGYLNDGLTGRIAQLRVVPHEGDVFDRLLTGWVPPTPSLFMVKRSALIAAGGFDETFPCAEDTDLWLRLAEASHHFAAVDRPLIIKHEGLDSQITSDPVARLRAFQVFDRKWRSVIERRLGTAGYRKARAKRLANVQHARWMQVRLSVMKGDRRAAWKHWLAMVRFLPWSGRFLARALRYALYGSEAHRSLEISSKAWSPGLAGHPSRSRGVALGTSPNVGGREDGE